jgi:preprotein translocase subunit Sec63
MIGKWKYCCIALLLTLTCYAHEHHQETCSSKQKKTCLHYCFEHAKSASLNEINTHELMSCVKNCRSGHCTIAKK